MRRAIAFGLALAPACALAFLGTTVKVGVRDAETNQPLQGAFVVVREFAEVGKFHGSSRYCVRAQVAAVDAPWLALRLPSPGTDALVGARALEGFAYRPGYCMARIGNAASAAGHKRMSLGMAPPPELRASEDNSFALRRGSQTAEERLLYLEQVTSALSCHEARWGNGSKEAMARLADAMAAEANGIARNKYEKHLARKVAGRLEHARGLSRSSEGPSAIMGLHPANEGRITRDFHILPAGSRVAWGDGSRAVVGITSGPMAAAVATRAPSGPHDMRAPRSVIPTPTPPAPAPFVVHCRHGAPSACDLDERDGDGATLLHGLAWAGRLDEVRALLDAGADPNATRGPGGQTPMDVVLRQVMAGYGNAGEAAQVLDAIAASPRATLSAALKEDLAADPSTWRLVSAGPARERLLRHREALLRLPVRAPDPKPGCDDPGLEYSFREGPVRLR